MRILSLTTLLVILLMLFSFFKEKESPHGDKFKVSCSVCHSPNSWKLDKAIYSFDHNKTALPLVGSHKDTECRACHPSLVFSEAKTECFSCHTDVHENTTGNDCSRCHTPKSWIIENTTAMHRQSRFPLVGAHATAECAACHKSATLLKFEPLGIACFDCHQASYVSTTKPNHAQSGFSTNCEECHSINNFGWNWTGGNINHAFFPLTAGHANVACNKCHTSGTYSNISKECSSCHLNNYNQTTNPNHLAAQFPTTCYQCHTTNPGWKPATFDHSKFPLTNGHNLSDCSKCHASGLYANLSTDCITCHQQTYNQTTNPNHIASQIPTSCANCHTTLPGWIPASYTHTSFSLTLGHAISDCGKCHINNNFVNTSTDCVSCHLANYNTTTNPNHSTSQIPTTCFQCHTTIPGWKPATYNHTTFAMTNGHANVDCIKCHVNNNYINTSSDCASCHLANYNQTTNPNHASSQIPTTCVQCHSTLPGWKPASYNHTNFAMTNGHANLDCLKCHVNGNFVNTSTDCVSCHLVDYNATTNPKHSTANVPTTCATCHTTLTGWKPALFTIHDSFFPIYSGKHRGTWNACSDCHINSSNYGAYDCSKCHPLSEMNSKHSQVPNYSSSSCILCHPTGTTNKK